MSSWRCLICGHGHHPDTSMLIGPEPRTDGLPVEGPGYPVCMLCLGVIVVRTGAVTPVMMRARLLAATSHAEPIAAEAARALTHFEGVMRQFAKVGRGGA